MNLIRTLAIVVLSVLSIWAAGCAPGGVETTTDLFLMDIWTDSGLVRVGEPRNLTQREGYDNQPSWSRDGQSILYASRSGDAADAYRWNLATNETTRITRSEDKEFSPQETPDGSGVTAVRLERNNSLRVWRYDLDGQNPSPLLPAFRDEARYYDWIDDDTLALAVSQDGELALYIAQVGSGEVERVVVGVGRSLNRVPGKRALSVVIKETPADWWIVELDLETRSVNKLARTLQGVEDHAWTPSGELLMGTGARLYMFVPGQSERWEEIADFANSGMAAVSRIAVSPDGSQVVIASELSSR